METRASYVTVGGFVLLLFVGGLALAMWLGDVQLDRPTKTYQIHFSGSVSGLNTGSPVRYRGIPVGSVTSIDIAPENVELIRVLVDVDADIPIKTDMYAVLEAQGLTGIGFIQIRGGTEAAADLVASAEDALPEIPSRASTLDKVISTAPEIADQLVVLMARAQGFLSERNERAFGEILTNLAAISGALASRTDEIDTAVREGTEAVAAFRQVATDLRPVVAELDRAIAQITEEVRATLSVMRGTLTGIDDEVAGLSDQLSKTTGHIEGVSAELEELLTEARPGIRDFSNSGLYELTQFLVEARIMVGNLDRLVRELDRDPRQFLFGNRQGQVEAK